MFELIKKAKTVGNLLNALSALATKDCKTIELSFGGVKAGDSSAAAVVDIDLKGDVKIGEFTLKVNLPGAHIVLR